MKSFTIAAAILAVSVTAAVPALAATDNSATCRTLGQQVNEAVAGAAGDATEAKSEQRAGADACTKGFYAFGSNHYRKALSLLGK